MWTLSKKRGNVGIFNYFYVMYGCFASMCVHTPHVLNAHRGQKRVGFPGTGTIDSCKLQYGCWKSNPGLLELQPVLATTENSLQPLSKCLIPAELSCL